MNKTISYRPTGVCARGIRIEIDGERVAHVEFEGGCPGNTFGVARLVEGMTVEEAVRRLSGIRCGSKPTSCPDQLARALREAVAGS